MLWPQRGKTQRFTTWPSSVLYHNKLLNNVFILFYFYVKAVPPHMHITMHTKKYLDAIIHLWLVTGRVKTWCGGPTMSLCPKSTAGVAAQCVLWLGALTSPCGSNSKIISFHLQIHRRSKPDQIEERSVSSVWARSTRGSATTHFERLDIRFECLFLLVLVCLLVILVIFSHSHDWWQPDVLIMSYIRKHFALPYIHRKTGHSNPTITITELLLILMKAKLKSGEFKFNSLKSSLIREEISSSPLYSKLMPNRWVHSFIHDVLNSGNNRSKPVALCVLPRKHKYK